MHLIRGYLAEGGVTILPGSVHVAPEIFPSGESFPFFSGIDPYGDTVFNHLQAGSLIEELDRAPRDGLIRVALDALEGVRRLALECRQSQQGTLLLFEGD